ncbi:hypothetical protein MNBD_ALPHA12-2024 [hydrothermal vent metagenome]|uniref:Uncharacterized protein n=1 Tax=hydrothermal vent metagenome TaxID=652676 RepID=A0A3B0TII1_9ZZZZ
MRNLAKTLTMTVIVGAISATGFATIASAHGPNNGQNNGPNNRFGPNVERNQGPHNGQQFGGPRNGGGFGPIRLVCSERGQTRIENGFDRLAQRVDLSKEQLVALENLKTAALAAQAGFSQACADFKPVKGADLIDRMKSRQTAIAARLIGMQSVMPTLEIFFDSLSDQQKAQLRPPMPPHKGMGAQRNGPHGDQYNQDNSGAPVEAPQTNG